MTNTTGSQVPVAAVPHAVSDAAAVQRVKGWYGSVGSTEAVRTPCLKGVDQMHPATVDLEAAEPAKADLQAQSPAGADDRSEQAEA